MNSKPIKENIFKTIHSILEQKVMYDCDTRISSITTGQDIVNRDVLNVVFDYQWFIRFQGEQTAQPSHIPKPMLKKLAKAALKSLQS